MSAPRILVLGTHNRKKGQELAELLEPYGFALRTLSDFADPLTVDESGRTFADNAALKATVQAQHLRHWVIGEDSGLCVDALQGAPGVYSARFAGADADDAANNRQLLEALGDTPLPERTGHYVCHMTLSDPLGHVRGTCEAACYGRIRPSPAGTSGFGYDPLFEVVEYHRTFGQLGPAVKSVLSHRSRAVRLFLPQLLHLVRSGQWNGPFPKPGHSQ